jgi:hypothetical protein
MSKIKKNKIISLTFGLIAVTLVFLSFQKTSFEDEVIVENSFQNTEFVDSEKVYEADNLISEFSPTEINSEIKKETEETYLNYSLILDSKKITGIFLEGDSLYESLSLMKEKDLINFEEKNFSGLGSYIYSIEGISENRRNGEYWIYYVNNKKANVGVSNYLLKEKDEIRWHLENNTY